MGNRGWLVVVGAIVMAAGATALPQAQKGGKPKQPSELAATAAFTCPEATFCGIAGDPSGSNPARLLTSTNEMNISLAGSQISLYFNSQNGANVEESDCFGNLAACLWNWTAFPESRTFTTDFQMQSNTLDTLGETELPNGLLGMPADGQTVHLARVNMTITVPETESFWRFNFNPNIPSNGGASLAKVVRNDACTWTFSAVDGEKAALSTLVKPPKGKQYVHREGRYSMPFVLTFTVLELCPAG